MKNESTLLGCGYADYALGINLSGCMIKAYKIKDPKLLFGLAGEFDYESFDGKRYLIMSNDKEVKSAKQAGAIKATKIEAYIDEEGGIEQACCKVAKALNPEMSR